MGDHAGNSPTDGRMLRRKRVPTSKEMSAAIAGERTFPPEGVLEGFCVQECVDTRFPTEKPGFPLFVIARQMSPQKHPSADPSHRGESCIGRRRRVRDR